MNTDQPILKELNQRKSVRGFLAKEIEQEKLDALWAAARWAPSCANRQDWHYYAVTGAARERLAEVLNPGNHWALKAPLILCVTRDTSVEVTTESRSYGMYDAALSVMSLVVEAEHQGLRARQMAGFKEEPFRKVLKLPPNEAPVVIVAVGYEEKLENLDPALQEKETQPRERKPIEAVVTIV
jgi:nitroreductase